MNTSALLVEIVCSYMGILYSICVECEVRDCTVLFIPSL